MSNQLHFIHLGPVVRRLISVNPRLNFNLDFFFVRSKALFRLIFAIFFTEYQIIKLYTKRMKLNLPIEHSYLNWHFALPLGYVNPTLNNLAQGGLRAKRLVENSLRKHPPKTQHSYPSQGSNPDLSIWDQYTVILLAPSTSHAHKKHINGVQRGTNQII